MPVEVTPFVTLAVGTSAYAAGDALGAKASFPNIPRRGTIMAVTLINRADTPASDNVDLVLFNVDITGTAANAAFDPTDAELQTCQGAVLIDTYKVFLNNEIGIVDNVGLPYYAPLGELFFQCVLRAGTPTFADDDIRISISIIY